MKRWTIIMRHDLFSAFRSFLGDRRANFGIMTALLVVPLLIAVTIPIDTVRALSVRTVVRQASDAAALAAATSNLPSKVARKDLADAVFQSNLSAAQLDLNISSAQLKESSSAGGSEPDTFTYEVVATVGDGATILPIGTLFEANIASVVKTGNQKIDIALVLDNSGSMRERDGTSSTRMAELQTAANAFVDQFSGNNQVKMAVVPFDSQVRVNTTVGIGDVINPYEEVNCEEDFESGTPELEMCLENQTTTTYTEEITTTPEFEMDCSLLTGATSYETQWCNSGKLGFNLPEEEQGRWVVGSERGTECVEWGWYWFTRYCKRERYTDTYELDSRVYVAEKKSNGRYQIARYSGTCQANRSYNQGDWTPCGTVHSYERIIFDQPEPAPVTQTVTRTVTAFSNGPRQDKDESDPTRTPDADLIYTGTETYDGCYTDRAQPYDITGYTMPNPNTETKLRRAQCANDSLSYTAGLTNQHHTVKSTIDGMTPAGWTNITIGMAWGMEALSQTPPLTGARSSNTTRKIIVLMTDGENTQNYWKNVNVRMGNRWVVSQTVLNSINARTLAACQTAKDQGVEIYTVNLVDADSSLLSQCATDPANALTAIRGGLEDAFKDVANQIKRTYLAG
ncbi:VWA domain-containing protein [Notoacmeibacter ruber]|uniref:VWA domain-containing protein n=1 Tax=Notoacmeibacter ruber TaxID=2670375 RepID=A0A3L7JF04_9HYPH|nr:pilus assembly protein [Notoacmeibacter ruber]RLQ89060.1 VWA domain-containing protein [Notoacmeibacter ruber]